MANEDFTSAITALERKLAEHERKGNELRSMINYLCEEAGEKPRYAISEAGSTAALASTTAVLTQIKRDTFYGKKQMTAIREYLDMRRAQGDGPATPQEILEALKAGGYKFEAKNDEIALVSLRALLRKATNVFHKLPGTRAYGLMAWYPGAKPGNDDDEKPRKGRRGPKRAGKPRRAKGAPSDEPKAEQAAEAQDDA